MKLAYIVLLAALAPSAAHAQIHTSVAWPPADAWVTSVEPKCGTVYGRVIRWPSGFGDDSVPKPVYQAFVQLADSSTEPYQLRSPVTASTDAAGEFHLVVPKRSAKFVSLVVRLLGFEPVIASFDPTRYRAFVVEVGLRSSSPHYPEFGLSVQAVRGTNRCTE